MRDDRTGAWRAGDVVGLRLVRLGTRRCTLRAEDAAALNSGGRPCWPWRLAEPPRLLVRARAPEGAHHVG